MSDEDLCFLSLAEVSRSIASREISPVSVVRGVLERIEALDGAICSYVTVMGESALSAAEEAEREIARGDYRGPLHGVPVSLKDLIHVGGVRTTAGSKAMADFIADRDAAVVERLRAAGAVILGKTQSYELAMGPKTVYNFGVTRNPWDLSRVTMGSSSGSGAAVAAGLCYAALGTDTGGSVRAPASACGVVGFKPTKGRVSRRGVLPLSWTQDCVGPLVRTVADCALVMSAIAGFDPEDPTSLDAPVPNYTRALEGGIQGLRIGVPGASYLEGIDPEFGAAVQRAIELLESAGARLQEVTFPLLEQARAARPLITAAEAFSIHEGLIRDAAHLLGPNVRARLELGSLVSAADYLKAQRVRTLFQREFISALREIDVVVTPVSTGAPPRLDEETPLWSGERQALQTAADRFRWPFNMAGAPAISVPCGFSSAGLPVGLQIAAKPMDEEVILRVAHAYEQLTPWHHRRPPIDK